MPGKQNTIKSKILEDEKHASLLKDQNSPGKGWTGGAEGPPRRTEYDRIRSKERS